jgi:hypothetical protein
MLEFLFEFLYQNLDNKFAKKILKEFNFENLISSAFNNLNSDSLKLIYLNINNMIFELTKNKNQPNVIDLSLMELIISRMTI